MEIEHIFDFAREVMNIINTFWAYKIAYKILNIIDNTKNSKKKKPYRQKKR